MCRITEEEFKRIMTRDYVKDNHCIEISFYLEGDPVYDYCWMGVMPDQSGEKPLFWFGLTADLKQAYDFSAFDEFWTAPVFHGESLKTGWAKVCIDSINGCSVESMLPYL